MNLPCFFLWRRLSSGVPYNHAPKRIQNNVDKQHREKKKKRKKKTTKHKKSRKNEDANMTDLKDTRIGLLPQTQRERDLQEKARRTVNCFCSQNSPDSWTDKVTY